MEFKLLEHFSKENNIELTGSQLRQFERFAELLVEKNKVMNLTAITDPAQIEIKHMIDSLEGAALIRELAGHDFSLLDIGCGAGFPGIPLKIIFPENNFTLLDSLNKRISFVNEVISDLKLQNISALAARAEDFKEKDNYDICTSRAVAALNVLCEYSLPFLKVGGHCLFYKSKGTDDEIAQAAAAIRELGGEYLKTVNFELPLNSGTRSIVVVKKIKETPSKYPRKAGKPSKSPIR